MGDFVKIFLGITALAGAFLVGKNHGEKSFLQSEEYKKISLAKEELGFTKGEVENAKAKLQNIVDRGTNQKTDELLGQILQVFLVDLGIQIQNKELILKQAEICSARAVASEKSEPTKSSKIKKTETEDNKLGEAAVAELKKETARPKVSVGQFKSNEWILTNSNGGNDTLKSLDKVVIKNLNAFMSQTVPDSDGCESFLGLYKGNVKDVNNKNFGSLSFDLKNAQAAASADDYTGKISWYNDPNPPLSQMINESCGRKAKGLSGRIFSLSDHRYIQIYQLEARNQMAGNFYEVLPNGTTKRIGKFVLRRTDQF